MGSGPHLYPGYREWVAAGNRGGLRDYTNWLSSNGYSNGAAFLAAYRGNQGSMSGGQFTDPNTGLPYPVPTGPAPMPGQPTGGGPTPTPIAPPTNIPNPAAGPPAYAPPQVQMPALLANPQPQGLGGMPLVRDRMMSSTMSPFAQPNWGIQQVNPAYLTQTVRLPGGATPEGIVTNPTPSASTPVSSDPRLVGLGGKRQPRIMYGLGK